MKYKFFIGLFYLFAAFSYGYSQSGISGKITDKNSGETLIGAAVFVTGTTKGTITDFDGNYSLNLEPGTYSISVQFVSYETSEIKDVTVKSGSLTTVNVALSEAVTELESVTVTAKTSRESETLLLIEQKKASIIKESIGAQQLSKLGVSDAATATSKITGVTKSEASGDVYIRGLGDRYLITTMNGLPIPSDDIEKKNINLKLFSTDVISSIGISKTYDVSSYGDQASGQVDIISKRLTQKNSLEISSGINSNILSEDQFGNFRATQNIDDLKFGFYDQPYSTEEAITKQSWDPKSRNLPVNYGFSVIGGDDFVFDNNKKLYIFGTVSHEGDSEYRTGVYRKFRSNTRDKEFTDAENYITTIGTNGLLNVSLDISSKHSLSYNSLFINKTKDELYEAGRNLEGFIFEQQPKETENFVRDQNVKETTLLINQLYGQHHFNSQNSLNWAVSYNLVNADEPNRIRNEVAIYEYPEQDSAQFATTAGLQQRKSNQYIKDREINGYIQDEIDLINDGDRQMRLNLGFNFRHKTRDFSSRKIAVDINDIDVRISSIDNMDAVLLNDYLYSTDSLSINDALLTDTYSALLNVYAGFVNATFGWEKLSGNIGLRYELDQMLVDWNVANFVGRTGSTEPSYSNVFPALNLKYQLRDNNAVRMAMSKTITIPEFKEMAPFEYVDPTGDVFKGNPELKNSINYNVDLKWELYPTVNELVSLATFYKKINNPINLALTRGSSGFFKYENTGKAANVFGIEVESRIAIINRGKMDKPGLDLAVNTTKMWHNQDLLKNFQYNNLTESGLQGASDFIGNASLSFSTNSKRVFMSTLTANYSSDKIFALGAPESQASSDILYNDQIIEEGFLTVDFVLSQEITDRLSIKIKGGNLLNPDINRTQMIDKINGPEYEAIVRSYKKGSTFSITLSMNLN